MNIQILYWYACIYLQIHIRDIHMNIYTYIYIYMYGIHHWMILWGSYRKMVWVGFELMTTEFRSDAVTHWAIRPWGQLTLRANFVQLLQFHRSFSVKLHFSCCLHQLPRLFYLKFSWGNHMSVAEWMIHMLFTTEGFFEVAIESWSEQDLNSQPPNSVS